MTDSPVLPKKPMPVKLVTSNMDARTVSVRSVARLLAALVLTWKRSPVAATSSEVVSL